MEPTSINEEAKGAEPATDMQSAVDNQAAA